MSVGEYIDKLSVQLAQHVNGVHTAQQAVWWILTDVTGHTKAELLAKDAVTLTGEQQNNLDNIMYNVCVKQMPLQYALGTMPFGPLTLTIRPPVLIPRPETEEWCYVVADMLSAYKDKPLKILDLCTGSGCIGLFFASLFPRSHVYLVDLFSEAMHLARENAQKNTISNVTIMQSDLFDALPNDFSFDVIVSNPPYVTEDEFQKLSSRIKKWEDPRAFVAHDEGLAIIKRVIDGARVRLPLSSVIDNKYPRLYIEIGHEQGKSVAHYMTDAGFTNVSVWRDMEKNDRVVWGCVPDEAISKKDS